MATQCRADSKVRNYHWELDLAADSRAEREVLGAAAGKNLWRITEYGDALL